MEPSQQDSRQQNKKNKKNSGMLKCINFFVITMI